MKRKEYEELKAKPVVELQKELRVARERLRALKFDLAAGKTKNVRELRSLKKDIARILTILRETKKL
ncbi:50S ribosomal protein L29 [Candidatus Wolfebacteria bacterium RIFCSPLOWO2_01_FULL_45_19]|uniref:Large ribosomal subunit protein uL29 n=1 Tax=Candidatus Wolfebacteria bacterium RIFCSPLOWO2_01_FULL_45_19 TaxID=1802557 RepID=A0A1F8DUW3_9BACT|nr:MAG: 50S ribosomal protein L29 [Parcubacteria group bacterium GW2011_GWB1_45_9]OGM91608.1 MAG: 50S ribosomal protein L29 [Candidatus Wolfebacteria bacterium RIFCSPLOWO2_01_FULL_45_19]